MHVHGLIDRVPPRPDLLVEAGMALGKYRIVGPIGQGGMGVVYEAQDTLLLRSVAIKMLSSALAADASAIRRFLVEARAAARLNHPHVVAVHEAGAWNGIPYIVMELVAQGSSQEALRGRGRLPWPEATHVVRDACRGLVAAHAAGLIHRDIKPSNILRAADGLAKLADFGLAKVLGEAGLSLTAPGLAGTPHYMSPEQCRGEAIDEGSDIYSLGATYYTLLTGRPPYPVGLPVQVMFAHCSQPLPDPRACDAAIPEACVAVVRHAMAKRQDQRYPSSAAMLADLEALSAAPGVISVTRYRQFPVIDANGAEASAATLSLPAGPPARRSRRLRWVPAWVGLAMIGFIVASPAWFLAPPQPETGVPAATPWQHLAAAAERALQTNDAPTLRQALHDLLAFRQTPASADHHSDLGATVDRLRWALLSRGGDPEAALQLPLGGNVTGLACSPDLRWLAASNADGDGGVKVWDFETVAPCLSLWPKSATGTVEVHAVAFSRDSQTLAAGCSGGIVRLWHFDSGRDEILTVGSNRERVVQLAFAPDGALATLLMEVPRSNPAQPAVRVWNLASRRPLYHLPVAAEPVYALAVAPAGSALLASGGNTGMARLWDGTTGAPGQVCESDISALAGLTFSPDGHTLVVSGYRRGGDLRVADRRLQFWERTGATFREAGWIETDLIRSMAYSPDGRLLAATDGFRAALWNARTLQLVTHLEPPRPGGKLSGLTFSAGGGMLITGGAAQTIRLLDIHQFHPSKVGE